tara:strand:- start:857 stop:1318 length:462 start_codon:yes stop_codon:yes gene_type:complete
MLAELAACNAAFGIVKKFVQNGRSIADCAKQIGIIAESKDKLQKKVQKKRTGFMGSLRPQLATDLEEFMALESIKEAEADLKQLMIYNGRAGLWDSWLMFQKEARVNRREAEKEADAARADLMFKASIGIGVVIFIGGLVGMFYFIILIKSQI